jgi:DNA-binding response OmpR family regulator
MRVLVVEHQPQQARALRRCLQEEGFQVDLGTSAEEASHKVRTTSYDLILLSMLLPGEQGFGLLRGWRASGVRTPILALTGPGRVAERVRCLELGADDYLPRPFQVMELTAHARALLRRAHQIYDPLLRVGDLEIDTATRTVKRAGRFIPLTRREYALLEFLAFHRGKVVTRSMIWEHLYDEQAENTSNVVDVYIRYLRNKIDKGFDPPLIRTRWGEGYMIPSEDMLADEGCETAEPCRQR